MSISPTSCTSPWPGPPMARRMFGIHPDLHRGELELKPEFPADWDHASFRNPDFSLDWETDGNTEHLAFRSMVPARMTVRLKARRTRISGVLVNGSPAAFTIEAGIGCALIAVAVPECRELVLDLAYAPDCPAFPRIPAVLRQGAGWNLAIAEGQFTEIHDPRSVLRAHSLAGSQLGFTPRTSGSPGLFFARVRSGDLDWWQPVEFPGATTKERRATSNDATFGFDMDALTDSRGQFRTIPIDSHFNSRFVDIFADEYRSPRSPFCSLQVPTNLYPPNWSVVDASAVTRLDDSELRGQCADGQFLAAGIPFRQPADRVPDTAFVSRWDRFPQRLSFAVPANRGQVFLLVTGYTNQMQCEVVNARIQLRYSDGSADVLELVAPFNFRSIEAGPGTERPVDSFCYGNQRLTRVRIGSALRPVPADPGDNGLYAQVVACRLRPVPLQSLELEAVANDVVFGVMGITVRD